MIANEDEIDSFYTRSSQGVQILSGEESGVEFKGTGNGLTIRVHLQNDGAEIKQLIKQRVEEKPDFYKGATVSEISCEVLSDEAKRSLETWLVEDYQMVMNKKKPADKDSTRTKSVNTEIPGYRKSNKAPASGTRFIEGTLRSGQKIEHPGDIVVLGDVNPGAELEAGGNIVVMGSLRGIAHAGLNGSDEAFVAALLLQPTQLRINQTITRSPDESSVKTRNPEMAKLKDQRICVESFLIRNKDNE